MNTVIIRRKRTDKVIRRKLPTPVILAGHTMGWKVGRESFTEDEYNQAWRCANNMTYAKKKVA